MSLISGRFQLSIRYWTTATSLSLLKRLSIRLKQPRKSARVKINKLQSNTELKVSFQGNMRMIGDTKCSRRGTSSSSETSAEAP